MVKLKQNIEKLSETKILIDEMKRTLADLNNLKVILEESIVNYFIENMIKDKIKFDIIGTVSAKYESVYSIKGGAKETPERNKLLSFLEEIGIEGIETYKGMHETKLQKAIAALPLETIQKFKEEGLITIWQRPKIKITKPKK